MTEDQKIHIEIKLENCKRRIEEFEKHLKQDDCPYDCEYLAGLLIEDATALKGLMGTYSDEYEKMEAMWRMQTRSDK